MATIALHTVLAQMPVILAVTGRALLRHLHRARRLAMAGCALQLAVGAEQRKMRFLGMIEHPERPAIARRATVAFVPESTLVNVIVGMAIGTLRGCLVESQRGVTLRATDEPVQPQQRVFRQVMIEGDAGSPSALGVTGFATARELASMGIVSPMASRTVLRQRLFGNNRGVTGMASDLGMRLPQWEFRLGRVIVIDRMPLLIVVAVVALFPEAPCVGIICRVAAVTILGDFFLVIAAAEIGRAHV